MTSQNKRRIQVASFSFNDIARSHVAALALGAALILGAGATAWVAATNVRAAADSKGSARLLTAASGQVIQGTQGIVSGGGAKLSQVLASSGPLRSSMADLRASAGSPVVAPSLKDLASSAYLAANNLLGSLSDMAPAITATAELSDAVSKNAANFAALSKAIHATGKAESAYSKSNEAVARLYSYAEAGFGMGSTPRVDYDLRVIVAELGQSELRAAVTFAAPLAGLSQVAASKMATTEHLSKGLETASAAKSAGELLGAAAAQSDASLMLTGAAAALLIAGLGVLGYTLTRVLDDFGRRYHRGVQQFRGGETARQALTDELRQAAESGTIDFTVTEAGGELTEISRLINGIARQQADHVSRLQAAAHGALSGEAAAGTLLAAAEEQSRNVVDGLRDAAIRLSEAAQLANLVSLDAQAASHAADEAAARSADANRVAQDAASRMEALREGLQETSKGIKRLGERTQEINGVVDTMELLSEQIGVLALNASLEAERAGEAGAGFRLVAKEVQSLAQRSEAALVQISGLIQGAQADARSAAELIDRSTNHVVSGSNVGAVSHALLVALPPLAASVESMTRSIADAGREGKGRLGKVEELLRGAAGAADGAADKSAQVRAPLGRVRVELELVVGGAQ